MDLGRVQCVLGVKFRDEDLLLQALTHSSCFNEPQMGYKKANESLAWLGDAFIHWVVSEHEYNSDLSVETLTENRKKYVETGFLASLAERHGLNNSLIMTRGEEKKGGRINQKNLHTVFEATVGAIYLDQEFCEAKVFVKKAIPLD